MLDHDNPFCEGKERKNFSMSMQIPRLIFLVSIDVTRQKKDNFLDFYSNSLFYKFFEMLSFSSFFLY